MLTVAWFAQLRVRTAHGTRFGRTRRCPLGQSQLGQLPGAWLPCGQGMRPPLSPRQGLRAANHRAHPPTSATACHSLSDGGEEQVKVLGKMHNTNGRELHGHEYSQLSNRNVERLHACEFLKNLKSGDTDCEVNEPRLCMSVPLGQREARAPGTCLAASEAGGPSVSNPLIGKAPWAFSDVQPCRRITA